MRNERPRMAIASPVLPLRACRARATSRLVAGLAAFMLLSIGGLRAQADALRVAVVPPVDRSDVLHAAIALGKQLGFEVEELTPEQLVDADTFTASRYHIAVYTGHERYVYEVQRPGDGAEALLRYLGGGGGTLLVSGVCWPFCRPAKWVRPPFGSEFAPYEGPLPQYQGPEDTWLHQQMARLSQSPVGTFNRFLGLNIAGEGTEQFEQPPEQIEFAVTEEGLGLFPSLPERFAFPRAGDLRYRPASARNLDPDLKFTSVAEAVGDSGKNYGPSICVVEHTGGELAGGMVVYIWGTLVQGEIGQGLLLDAFRLAAERAGLASAEQQHLARRLAGQLEQVATIVEQLEVWPERSYLDRERRELERRIKFGLLAGELGNATRSQALLSEAEQSLNVLEARAAKLTQ